MDRHDSLIHDDETVESLYGGRLRILQKKKGYRYTIDSVLLAHFVGPRKGERILELGAGSGVITLLLAFWNPRVRVTG
ncbi:MAG: SAM-dependent methyltransferase, partial [Syntrophaceae bacterium]